MRGHAPFYMARSPRIQKVRRSGGLMWPTFTGREVLFLTTITKVIESLTLKPYLRIQTSLTRHSNDIWYKRSPQNRSLPNSVAQNRPKMTRHSTVPLFDPQSLTSKSVPAARTMCFGSWHIPFPPCYSHIPVCYSLLSPRIP